MAPIVYFLMKITSPISWPLAKILDLIMGEHEITRFNNVELKHLIKLHTKDALRDVSFNGDGEDVGLDNHQAEMIAGALTLESLKIGDNEKQILTPVMQMKFLMLDTVLDSQSIFWIKDVGYSRFPIVISTKYRFIVAILLSKSLIGLKPSTKTIQELYLEGKIKLKVPLYISKDAEISKVV
jgi:metal transporter CNNM